MPVRHSPGPRWSAAADARTQPPGRHAELAPAECRAAMAPGSPVSGPAPGGSVLATGAPCAPATRSSRPGPPSAPATRPCDVPPALPGGPVDEEARPGRAGAAGARVSEVSVERLSPDPAPSPRRRGEPSTACDLCHVCRSDDGCSARRLATPCPDQGVVAQGSRIPLLFQSMIRPSGAVGIRGEVFVRGAWGKLGSGEGGTGVFNVIVDPNLV